MATDACRRNLENIIRNLKVFENEPKQIDGFMIRKWFNVGEDIFVGFYNLGRTVKWNSSEVKTRKAEVDEIVSRITKNQGWLQSFITIYPGLRIDLEGATPSRDICQVRSGIEFLLRGFAGINRPFDKVINDLKIMGELEEFDDHLKIWTQGFRPEFFDSDDVKSSPQAHWWWF